MKRTALTFLAATLALAACGGGGSDDPGPSTAAEARPSTTERAAAETTSGGRPEGDWVLNRFVEDPGPDGDVLRAARRSWNFEPTCDEGPCDLVVTPAGPESTFLGPDYPVLSSDVVGEPFTVAYAGGVYSFVEPETTDYCARTDGTYSDDPASSGFEGRFELTFVDGNGDAPDQLVGTKTETWTPTPAGRAAGCVAETKTLTWTVTARPFDATFPDAEVDGQFGPTFVLSDVDDKTEALDPQAIGWERSAPSPWSLTTSCEGPECALGASFTDSSATIRSFGLSPGDGGWTGRAEPWKGDCLANGTGVVVAAGAYTNNLTVTDLRVVDETDGRATVLVGHFRETGLPDAAAASADPTNCFASHGEGQIFLVSTEAVDLLH